MEGSVRANVNSSQPSFQTLRDETAFSHAGPHAKGRAYDPGHSRNTRAVKTVTVSQVGYCKTCGESLRGRRSLGHERRTRINIVFRRS
jgi:hypothetical protein